MREWMRKRPEWVYRRVLQMNHQGEVIYVVLTLRTTRQVMSVCVENGAKELSVAKWVWRDGSTVN